MATFVSVSGPSSTGKTSIIDSLRQIKELQAPRIIISPDMHDAVWADLVKKGFFTEFTEISTDSDYLCTYILRLIDYYNKYVESLKDSDTLVILDGCWIDLAIYSILNMWYTRGIRSVQEEILSKVSKFDENISKIYITHADDLKFPVGKYRIRGKVSSFRMNRPLEIQYYDMAKHLQAAHPLHTTETEEAAQCIFNDLKNLGYL